MRAIAYISTPPCRNRSENLTNRKICFFWFETVSNYFFQLQKNIFFSMEKIPKKYFPKNKIFWDFFSIQFSFKMIKFSKISGKFSSFFQKYFFIFFSSKKIIFFLKLKKKLGTVSMQKNHIFRLVGFSELFRHSFMPEKSYLSIDVFVQTQGNETS